MLVEVVDDAVIALLKVVDVVEELEEDEEVLSSAVTVAAGKDVAEVVLVGA